MNSPVKITLLPVGPLTNIALALRTEPRIKEKIERIVLMGGAFFPPRAEYNIYRDRVAAEIVFRSGLPIVAVGLDVTEKCKLQGADLDRLRAAKNPASQFLVRLIELWQNNRPTQYPTLHDPLGRRRCHPIVVDRDATGNGSGGDSQPSALWRHRVQCGQGQTRQYPGCPQRERPGIPGSVRRSAFGTAPAVIHSPPARSGTDPVS